MTAPGTPRRPAVGIPRLKIAGCCPTPAHSRGVGRPGLSVPVATVECCAEEHPAPPGGVAPFHRRGPPVTYVRPHYRRDGTRVRGHHRSISPRTIAVAAGTGCGGLLLLLLLLALAGGPGTSSKAPASTTPSQSASVPATRHR